MAGHWSNGSIILLHLERHPGGYQGRGSAVDPLQFTKGKSKVKNAELKAAQNNAAMLLLQTIQQHLLCFQEFKKQRKKNLNWRHSLRSWNTTSLLNRELAQPQQQQSGGLGANPFVMPLTDPNAANLAPLTLFKLSQ